MLGTLGKGEDILDEEYLCAVIPGFVHGSREGVEGCWA